MNLADDPTIDRPRAASSAPYARSAGRSALYGVAVLVLVVQAVWTLEWAYTAVSNLGGPQGTEGVPGPIVFAWVFWLIGEVVIFPASLFAWAIMFIEGRRPVSAR